MIALMDHPIWQAEGKTMWLTIIVACLVMGAAVTAVGWCFRKLRLAIRYLVGV